MNRRWLPVRWARWIRPMLLLGGCLVLIQLGLQAQDPILSQYFANKLYLNPAYAGYEGGLTVNSTWREQWFRIAGRASGYRTRMVGTAMNVPRLQSGFGLQYFNHTEGPGQLTWERASLSYAFRTRNCKRNPPWELNLGLRASYNWTSLRNLDAFTFGDELDALRGDIRDTRAIAAFNGARPRPFVDLDVGMVYLQRIGKRRHDHADYLRLGLVASHLPGSPIERLGFADVLPMRFTLHTDWIVREKGFELISMFKLETQAATSRFLPDIEDRYWYWHNQLGAVSRFFNDRAGLWIGAWYQGRLMPGNPQPNQIAAGQRPSYQPWRNVHGLALGLGWEFPLEREGSIDDRSIRMGFSYDYQFTGLTRDGSGTLEFTLAVALPQALGALTSCRGICPYY